MFFDIFIIFIIYLLYIFDIVLNIIWCNDMKFKYLTHEFLYIYYIQINPLFPHIFIISILINIENIHAILALYLVKFILSWIMHQCRDMYTRGSKNWYELLNCIDFKGLCQKRCRVGGRLFSSIYDKSECDVNGIHSYSAMYLLRGLDF